MDTCRRPRTGRDLAAVPEINIGVMNRGNGKRNQKYNSYPGSAEEAKRDAGNRLGVRRRCFR